MQFSLTADEQDEGFGDFFIGDSEPEQAEVEDRIVSTEHCSETDWFELAFGFAEVHADTTTGGQEHIDGTELTDWFAEAFDLNAASTSSPATRTIDADEKAATATTAVSRRTVPAAGSKRTKKTRKLAIANKPEAISDEATSNGHTENEQQAGRKKIPRTQASSDKSHEAEHGRYSRSRAPSRDDTDGTQVAVTGSKGKSSGRAQRSLEVSSIENCTSTGLHERRASRVPASATFVRVHGVHSHIAGNVSLQPSDGVANEPSVASERFQALRERIRLKQSRNESSAAGTGVPEPPAKSARQ